MDDPAARRRVAELEGPSEDEIREHFGTQACEDALPQEGADMDTDPDDQLRPPGWTSPSLDVRRN